MKSHSGMDEPVNGAVEVSGFAVGGEYVGVKIIADSNLV